MSKLFAVVSEAGELARGAGVAEVTKLATGSYRVTFNQTITACAYIATIGVTGAEGFAQGLVDVGGAIGTTNAVFVQTLNTAGTATSKPFHLAVICP